MSAPVAPDLVLVEILTPKFEPLNPPVAPDLQAIGTLAREFPGCYFPSSAACLIVRTELLGEVHHLATLAQQCCATQQAGCTAWQTGASENNCKPSGKNKRLQYKAPYLLTVPS